MRGWTSRDSLELYQVPNWGHGFFGVDDAGHMQVRPTGEPDGPAIDLHQLIGHPLGQVVERPRLELDRSFRRRLAVVDGLCRLAVVVCRCSLCGRCALHCCALC